jgi:hypothetical protein
MSSITGEWILGLYATVGVPASPASFYFEIMDGSTVVVTGSSGTLVNLSSPLQLYTSSLFVPTRTYSSSVILNLYVTTQASSSLTLQFSGSTLSYLSTTIQPYNDILTANEYRFKTANGILLNSNGFSGITANPTPILQVDGSASIIGNLSVGGTANITGATIISNTAAITGVMTVSNDATIMSNLSVGTTIRNATGTNSAPTYTFTGDVSSGMFRPSASNIAWTTAGVERMRIDSSGNVGIGRSDPTFRLDVSGTARTSSNLTVGGTLNCGAITSTGALALAANSITSGTHNPSADNTYTLGAVGTRWANVHATNFTGAFTGSITGSSTSCTGNSATATLATNAQGLTGSPNITVGTLSATSATIPTIYHGSGANLYNQMILGWLIDWNGADPGPLWHTGGSTKGLAIFTRRANSVVIAPRVYCRLIHFDPQYYQDITNTSYTDWIGVETLTFQEAYDRFILYFV